VRDRTYGLTEIVGTSKDGIDAAVSSAIARASQSIRKMDWFEVSGIRGYIRDGAIDHVQVTVKIGYRMEDA